MPFAKKSAAAFLFAMLLWPQAAPAEDALPYKNGPYSFVPLLKQTVRKVGRGPLRFVVMGDSKHARPLSKTLELARSFKPDLLIFTGDFVQKGSADISDWLKWEEEIAQLARSMPLIPVEGNHELAGGDESIGRARFLKFFDLDKNHFFFDIANCRFIVLGWKFQRDSAQVSWLEQALKGGMGKHIFVSAHIPFFTVGRKSTGEVSNKETRFTRMFSKYGVACVFAGHDHIYYRTDRGGVTYVISAGAGAGIYELLRKDEAIPGDVYVGREPGKSGSYLRKDPVTGAEVRETVPHYVVEVLVQGAQVVCRTVNVEGKEWDRFVPVRLRQPARPRR